MCINAAWSINAAKQPNIDHWCKILLLFAGNNFICSYIVKKKPTSEAVHEIWGWFVCKIKRADILFL